MRETIRNALVVLLISYGGSFAQQSPPQELILKFEGNRIFSEQKLRDIAGTCFDSYQSKSRDESQALNYCLSKTQQFLFSQGYLQATLGDPKIAKDQKALHVEVQITEGALYRLGGIKVEGSKLFSSFQIRDMLALKTGDVADGESISNWAEERVSKLYAKFGYVQYSAALKPDFRLRPGADEGIVDLTVVIDEGKVFKIRSINFDGNEDVSKDTLLREMLVQNGEVFNAELFVASLKRIDQTGWFKSIDPDRDVDYSWDKTIPQLDLTIHLKKKT